MRALGRARVSLARNDLSGREDGHEVWENACACRLLFDNSPQPMWVCDLETLHFIEVNQAAIAHYGYSRREFLGMLVTDIGLAEEVPRLLRSIRRDRRGSQRSGPWKHRLKDGRLIDVEVAAHTLRFRGRKSLLVTAHDITEHKRTEEALRASEERYRLLTELSPDIIYRLRLSPVSRYEFISPIVATLTGYSPEDFYSDPDLTLKIIHPDDRPLAEAVRRNPASFSQPLTLRVTRKDGSMLWSEIHCAPIYDENEELLAIVGISRDIGERKRAEQELEKLRSEFLAMVSHELKAPLAAIKGAAISALESQEPLEEQDRLDLSRIICGQVDRLRNLVNNLLDMSSIEAGAFSVTAEPSDLPGVLEEARALFLRSGLSRCVEVDVAEGLPAVKIDRRRIIQVITNLLNNAVKFSPPTTPIFVKVENDPVHATVHVQDHGQGIPEEKLPLLFKKFSILDRSGGDRLSGTGLGLAICKGIIEAHGGRIWAESGGIGQGATFSFTLPLTSQISVTSLTDVARRAVHLGRVKRANERTRVLAVDDEQDVLNYLRRLLCEAGYHPVVTSEPSEVRGLLEWEEPDLILLDVMLPGITGFELLERIREQSGVPVIFLSARDQSEDMVRALRMGADDYIIKPFSSSELVARIEAVLRRRVLPDTMETRQPFVQGDLTINFRERRVTVSSRTIALSPREYKVICELALYADRVLTYNDLLRRVWGPEYVGESDLVRSLMRHLRRKLGDDARKPRYVRTEHRIGYRMISA